MNGMHGDIKLPKPSTSASGGPLTLTDSSHSRNCLLRVLKEEKEHQDLTVKFFFEYRN